MTDAESARHQRPVDHSAEVAHLEATITKCSLAIRRAFDQAGIEIGLTTMPSGATVTWGIFYPAASAGLTILVSDLERVDGDDAAIAELVLDRIAMTREVLLQTADANENRRT